MGEQRAYTSAPAFLNGRHRNNATMIEAIGAYAYCKRTIRIVFDLERSTRRIEWICATVISSHYVMQQLISLSEGSE